MAKNVITFGLLIAALLILFQLSRFQLVQGNLSTEIIVAIVSIVFFFLGLYFRKKWNKQDINKEQTEIDYKALREFGLSDREQEVLQELVNGHSNKEIAERLFLSESTIKTHVSKIYTKLDVNRRPQAILKAQSVGFTVNKAIGTKVL